MTDDVTLKYIIINLLVTVPPTEMEFDLDKALEDVPIHVEDMSTRTPPTPSQVQPRLEHRQPGMMVELPSEEEKKLQHYTKLRPRRNKKTHSSKVPVSKLQQSADFSLLFKTLAAPTRLLSFTCNMYKTAGLVFVKWSKHSIRFFKFIFQQISSAPSQDGEQNGLMGRVDEGVDEFFSTKVTKMDSK